MFLRAGPNERIKIPLAVDAALRGALWFDILQAHPGISTGKRPTWKIAKQGTFFQA